MSCGTTMDTDGEKDNNTSKHRMFVAKLMSDKDVKQIPGVGQKGEEHFQIFFSDSRNLTPALCAYNLLARYLAFNKSATNIRSYLKRIGLQETYAQNRVVEVLRKWNSKNMDKSDVIGIFRNINVALKEDIRTTKLIPAYFLLGLYMSDRCGFMRWLKTWKVRPSYPRRTFFAIKEWYLQYNNDTGVRRNEDDETGSLNHLEHWGVAEEDDDSSDCDCSWYSSDELRTMFGDTPAVGECRDDINEIQFSNP